MPVDPKEHARWWNKITKWDRRMITSKGQKLGADWEERWRRTCENVINLRKQHAREGDPNGLLPIEYVWDMDECCTWFETIGSHTLHKRSDPALHLATLAAMSGALQGGAAVKTSSKARNTCTVMLAASMTGNGFLLSFLGN